MEESLLRKIIHMVWPGGVSSSDDKDTICKVYHLDREYAKCNILTKTSFVEDTSIEKCSKIISRLFVSLEHWIERLGLTV